MSCLVNAVTAHLGSIPIFWENALEQPSFTIEFPEHLPEAKRQYYLDHLKNTGALVEPQSERIFLIICLRRQQLARVDWALFHTQFQNQCQVISTSGGAETRGAHIPSLPCL
jgi:hypothetical protein